MLTFFIVKIMKERQKIYISIPITGHSEEKVREKADRVKAKLSREGWTVVSPFDIYAGRNPEYADYIAADIRALMDCDAIYMCRGWAKSCGCSIEIATARALKEFDKKPFTIIYEPV